MVIRRRLLLVIILHRYPDGLAWQFNVPKKVLRKSPEFKGFHSFLVFETEVVSSGHSAVAGGFDLIDVPGKHLEARSGQHAAPALHGRRAAPQGIVPLSARLNAISSRRKVMDMCAAPGSKVT
jgi:hypothetical protein